MVTDVMLREAAGEAENAILASLSLRTVELHQFSNQFQKKIDKLVRRAKHPIRYQFMRSAAAILLLVAILFGMVFAISPEVRAGVIGWIKSIAPAFALYEHNGNDEVVEYDYYFDCIPEGYSEMGVIDTADGKAYVYVNDKSELLKFSYARGGRPNTFFVKTDLHSHVEGFVSGNKADIYITESGIESNAIVWIDEETGTLLFIGAWFDQDTLVAFAESVTKAPKQS